MDSQSHFYTDPFNLDASPPDHTPASFSLQLSTPNGPQGTPIAKSSAMSSALASNSATQPLLPNLSPSPSTPAHQIFNPDDFFASPPNNPQSSLLRSSDRFTPELKRRLFGPADPLQSAPSTITRKKPPLNLGTPTPASIGAVTPIPHSSFANPLSSNGSDKCHSPLNISPALSPTRNLFPEVIGAAAQTVEPARLDFEKPNPTLSNNPAELPGTPFTPVTLQRAKCSCKASRCLKLYCPCFANSGFCGRECTCKNCQNTRDTVRAVREARETVLSRDPRAFDPKVRNSPATARGADIHTKGCNCRKGCSKNYCVCRELRVDCGPRCTCSGPNGCQNGKTDAMDNHHFRGRAKDILADGKPGSPVHGRAASSRAKLKSFGSKQEKKRQKRGALDRPMNTVKSENVSSIFSPGFSTLDIQFSPGMEPTDRMQMVKSSEGKDNDFVTPFAMRKDRHILTFKEAGQEGAFSIRTTQQGVMATTEEARFAKLGTSGSKQHLLNRQDEKPLNSLKLSNDDVLRLKRKITEFDKKINGNGIGSTKGNNDDKREDGSEHPAKRSRSLSLLRRPVKGCKTEELVTPENKPKVPDIASASSPATDGKDPPSMGWRQLRASILGKDDKTEICRLPRILRVKMGSGRLLRKFDV